MTQRAKQIELQEPVNFTSGKLLSLCARRNRRKDFANDKTPISLTPRCPFVFGFEWTRSASKAIPDAARLPDTLGLESIKRFGPDGWPTLVRVSTLHVPRQSEQWLYRTPGRRCDLPDGINFSHLRVSQLK